MSNIDLLISNQIKYLLHYCNKVIVCPSVDIITALTPLSPTFWSFHHFCHHLLFLPSVPFPLISPNLSPSSLLHHSEHFFSLNQPAPHPPQLLSLPVTVSTSSLSPNLHFTSPTTLPSHHSEHFFPLSQPAPHHLQLLSLPTSPPQWALLPSLPTCTSPLQLLSLPVTVSTSSLSPNLHFTSPTTLPSRHSEHFFPLSQPAPHLSSATLTSRHSEHFFPLSQPAPHLPSYSPFPSQWALLPSLPTCTSPSPTTLPSRHSEHFFPLSQPAPHPPQLLSLPVTVSTSSLSPNLHLTSPQLLPLPVTVSTSSLSPNLHLTSPQLLPLPVTVSTSSLSPNLHLTSPQLLSHTVISFVQCLMHACMIYFTIMLPRTVSIGFTTTSFPSPSAQLTLTDTHFWTVVDRPFHGTHNS